MNPKILIIDDDVMIVNSLKRVLVYEGFQVEAALNGEDGLALIGAFQPDLVILDVTMPHLSGIDVCKRIRYISSVPVLFLSARDEVGDRVLGLENGGDDYLVKPFAFEELLARIKVLLRRGINIKTAQLHFADLSVNTASHAVFRGNRAIELSTTEYQLLVYFIMNPRIVLTKDMILEAVWGYDFSGDSNIVEVYVRYLRTKLEQNGETRLIQTLRGSGYLLKEQENR